MIRVHKFNGMDKCQGKLMPLASPFYDGDNQRWNSNFYSLSLSPFIHVYCCVEFQSDFSSNPAMHERGVVTGKLFSFPAFFNKTLADLQNISVQINIIS